jgi:hypothetical protein
MLHGVSACFSLSSIKGKVFIYMVRILYRLARLVLVLLLPFWKSIIIDCVYFIICQISQIMLNHWGGRIKDHAACLLTSIMDFWRPQLEACWFSSGSPFSAQDLTMYKA